MARQIPNEEHINGTIRGFIERPVECVPNGPNDSMRELKMVDYTCVMEEQIISIGKNTTTIR